MSDMVEDSLKNFISSIIFLVKIFSGLKDKFLAQKLYDKISGFIVGYVKLFGLRGEGSDSMSHNVVLKDLLNSVNGLLELLDYLEHSKVVSISPLLYACRNLLDLKLSLIKSRQHQLAPSAPKPKEDKSVIFVSKNVKPRNSKENSNKERILNFIKKSPNSQTKEIIYEFSLLSNRTVKRNLKELLDEGFIKKISKDNTVYYNCK